jgi:hypothetical protein
MTHTTTQAGIRLQAQRIFSSRDSSGKPLPRWISLCWTMLSLVGEEPIRWVEGTTASGRQGCFENPNIPIPRILTDD